MHEFFWPVYVCMGLAISIPFSRVLFKRSEEISEKFAIKWYAVDLVFSLIAGAVYWPLIILLYAVKNMRYIFQVRLF